MKKILMSFFCVTLFAVSVMAQKTDVAAKSSAATSGLTSETVLNNYFKALGGKEKLESVKTLITEDNVKFGRIELSSTTKKMGNKMKSVANFMGEEMVDVFDGEKGYSIEMGQKKEYAADQVVSMKKEKVIEALNYSPADFKTVNTEQIDGKDYNVLASNDKKLYFDTVTGLLFKEESKEVTSVIKNYMTVDGVKFASEVETVNNKNGQKGSIKTTKITINSGVTDADFK